MRYDIELYMIMYMISLNLGIYEKHTKKTFTQNIIHKSYKLFIVIFYIRLFSFNKKKDSFYDYSLTLLWLNLIIVSTNSIRLWARTLLGS